MIQLSSGDAAGAVSDAPRRYGLMGESTPYHFTPTEEVVIVERRSIPFRPWDAPLLTYRWRGKLLYENYRLTNGCDPQSVARQARRRHV